MAIKDLNDISYISLHVFVPLHLELFTDVVKEGCYILTHHIPSNIIYHIRQDKVEIDGNFLRLVGDEKKYYFDYFGRKDIVEKMVKEVWYRGRDSSRGRVGQTSAPRADMLERIGRIRRIDYRLRR